MAIKLRKYCPHCGSQNVHTMTAYPFNKKRVVYFCGLSEHDRIPAGCGWMWCKPFDLWLMGKSLQEIEETGGIILFDREHKWEEIHRCSCGKIYKNSEANWIQLDWTPKGVMSMICPQCGKHGAYLESYFLEGE
jgi:endogenous inhibitor of DNA gyrase (YacG/DUF329 family)